jgi:hypothetical protein
MITDKNSTFTMDRFDFDKGLTGIDDDDINNECFNIIKQ